MGRKRPRGDVPKIKDTIFVTPAIYDRIKADSIAAGVTWSSAADSALVEYYKMRPRTCGNVKIHRWGEWLDRLKPLARDAVVELGNYLDERLRKDHDKNPRGSKRSNPRLSAVPKPEPPAEKE